MGVDEPTVAGITTFLSAARSTATKASLPSPPGPAATAAQEARGHQTNTKPNQAVIPLLYGEVRVGGIIVYESSSGGDNKLYHCILVVGEGETEGLTQVDGVDEAYLDSKLYTEHGDTVHYELFKGTANQEACATLQAACPEWNDPLRYTAHLYLRLTYDEDYHTQRPEITVGLKGLKTYDPGAIPPVVAHSNNPALMLYDLARRSTKRGGTGII
jgi:hypothetical protein